VWLACYQWLRELTTLGEWDDGLGGYGSSAPVIPTLAFLHCAAAAVRTHGYVSARAARSSDTLQATGREVWHLLTSTSPQAQRDGRALRASVTDADRELVRGALAWLASPEAGDSEYIHNLRIHTAGACVRFRGENMLASLLASYRKHIGDLVCPLSANEHLPGVAVKDRVRDLVVTLVRVTGYETDYGWTHVLTFEDSNGRSILWRTSSTPTTSTSAWHQREDGCFVQTDEVEVGNTYVLTGTVKALGEYKGRLQTELTRCLVRCWAVADEGSVETCSAVKPRRRAGSCPAQKPARGEKIYLQQFALDTVTFAHLAPTCDAIGREYVA